MVFFALLVLKRHNLFAAHQEIYKFINQRFFTFPENLIKFAESSRQNTTQSSTSLPV